jgi:hypothetical protein
MPKRAAPAAVLCREISEQAKCRRAGGACVSWRSVTSDGEFKLRVQGGNPFLDPEVDALVGTRIRGEGVMSAGQFIMERYEVLRG